MLKHLSSLILLLASPVIGTSVEAQQVNSPSPEKNEVLVGPINTSQDVEGVKVDFKMTVFFSAATESNKLLIRARTFTDLSDLQAKIGTIIDKQDLPRNNCRSYSANNPVVTVDRKRLDLQGASKALLTVSGDVDVWDCRENPVRCSKIEWRNDGLFGAPSPTVVWWDCNPPIKNKVVSQPVTMSLPMAMQKVTATSVKLNLEKPEVTLGGHPALSAVRDFVLDLFRVDINALAERKLRSAVDSAKLVAALPADFRKLNPEVEHISFGDVSGHLGLHMNLAASVTGDTMTSFLKIVADPPKTPDQR